MISEILALVFLLMIVKSIVGTCLKRQLMIEITKYRRYCVMNHKEIEVGYEDLGRLLNYTLSFKIGKNGLLSKEKLEKVLSASEN